MTLQIKEIFIEDYEKVVHVKDSSSDLEAIIAIHNTKLGPALGGVRIYPYQTFEEGLVDVLRLSKGMTYKSAAALTGLGGGKSVIFSSMNEKTSEKLQAFGRAVESLAGLYICAEDVGCSVDDVAIIRKETKYVTGLMSQNSSGNPAPYTAWGTYKGIQATLKFLFNNESVEGKTIALQGIGAVGEALAEYLFWNGAHLIISDVNAEKAKAIAHRLGATYVKPEEIMKVQCDVLAPCALGGILNSDTIPMLQCRAVAGCANNQLLDDEDANLLQSYGILYAPDFVINAGGLINVRIELSENGYHPVAAREAISQIYDRLLTIYAMAQENRSSTHEAAIKLAKQTIDAEIEQSQLCFHH